MIGSNSPFPKENGFETNTEFVSQMLIFKEKTTNNIEINKTKNFTDIFDIVNVHENYALCGLLKSIPKTWPVNQIVHLTQINCKY